MNVARLAEEAGAIVRSRKPAIVDDPLEHVAAAKFEFCRAHAAERRPVVRAEIDAAYVETADVRLAVVDMAVPEPQRPVRIAVDAAAESRIAGCDARVDDGLRADLCDRALQLDIPPVDR